MGTYLYRTENITVGTDPVTLTHALGVAPAGESGAVLVTRRAGTATLTITSTSQIVVLTCGAAGQTMDVLVMAFHSIIK